MILFFVSRQSVQFYPRFLDIFTDAIIFFPRDVFRCVIYAQQCQTSEDCPTSSKSAPLSSSFLVKQLALLDVTCFHLNLPKVNTLERNEVSRWIMPGINKVDKTI